MEIVSRAEEAKKAEAAAAAEASKEARKLFFLFPTRRKRRESWLIVYSVVSSELFYVLFPTYPRMYVF